MSALTVVISTCLCSICKVHSSIESALNRKNECILKSDEHLNKVFPEKSVNAYCRTPTLRDMLVKSPKPHGFYHCHIHNYCTTCSHSVKSTTFYAHYTGTNHNIQEYTS